MNEMYGIVEELCKSNNINITAMCRESGASRGVLTDLKMGRIKRLSTDTLSKIAEYFDVSVDYLLGKEKSPSSDELTRELGETEFALYGEVKELTDEQKQDILDYIRYKKAKGGWKE